MSFLNPVSPRRPAVARCGFTLIELLVVIAIIAILAAILFPVFAQAREKARSIACLSNAKQMALAIMQYSNDYDESLPVQGDLAQNRGRWFFQVYPYVKSLNVFACPNLPEGALVEADMKVGGGSIISAYGWNVAMGDPRSVNSANVIQTSYNLGDIQKPAGTIIIGDTGILNTAGVFVGGYTLGARNPALQGATTPSVSIPIFRHRTEKFAPVVFGNAPGTSNLPREGRANFCFLDGHAKSLTVGQAFEEAPLVGGVPTEDGKALDTKPAPGENILIPNSRYVLWNIY